MTKTRIALCITAYRRYKTFHRCYGALLDQLAAGGVPENVEIDLYTNIVGYKDFPQPRYVANAYNKTIDELISNNIIKSYTRTLYDDNVGKPYALNEIIAIPKVNFDYMLTIDQDMFFTKPFTRILDDVFGTYILTRRGAMLLDFDVMGFASNQDWLQLPDRSECLNFDFCEGKYTIYFPTSIAGGMMMVKRSHLEKCPWQNANGAYNMDDVIMSMSTNKKYIIEPKDCEWMDHDPFRSQFEDENNYYSLKTEIITEQHKRLERENIRELFKHHSIKEGWDKSIAED